jgi:hypothetical protein
VAFLPRGNINRPLKILYAEADHGLGVGLQDGQVDNKVTLQNVPVEIQSNAFTDMDFLERPFEGDHMFYAVTFLKGVIPKGFEGVSRGLHVLRF